MREGDWIDGQEQRSREEEVLVLTVHFLVWFCISTVVESVG
jgi:hypothetical protein